MRPDQESLIDIANAIRRILRYTHGISKSELAANDEKLSAILYQITIIGEATKRLLAKPPNGFPRNFGSNIRKFLGEKWPECAT
jgi:uncharacterized protein with HEPN domain